MTPSEAMREAINALRWNHDFIERHHADELIEELERRGYTVAIIGDDDYHDQAPGI